MHIIPADMKVARLCRSLRSGELIHLEGELVEATGGDLETWGSSLTRDDSAKGACELLFADSLSCKQAHPASCSVMTTEKAMFGAGCFWGVETTFRNIKGVTNAAVGYAGGRTDNPTYEEVCSDDTGHAEVVEVEYDPAQVSYKQLLDVFWANHDPTTLNRQGPDFGAQYRSVIFTYTPEQEAEAETSKATMNQSGRFRRPIVTFIEPAPKFYRGEEYHQRYLEKRGLAHCAI